MDLKKNNTFFSLLINSLKSKKGWFLLSTTIIFVTTLLIPYILKADEEFFIFFGIFELFVLVFINCLVDNNFLHNDSKLAYYKSKPVPIREQMSINIVSNMIFTAYLLLLILLSVVFQGIKLEILEVFKFVIPWLAAGVLLVSLSSILAGNTIMAGAMTIFNFCLPLIIYLVIMFVFSILENIVAGFSSSVLMEYFVNKFYNMEYIYFIKYSEVPIDFIYILLLGAILLGITLLIFKFLKRRKNENTGNLIVFDGYKYFVSVLASLIVPAAFSIMSYDNNVMSKITVSIVMALLSYYIIVAIIEKTFKISRLSLKVFAVSFVLFAAATGTTVMIARQHKGDVPDLENVKMAYVGNDRFVFNYIDRLDEDILNDRSKFLKWQKERGLILFTEKSSIENIADLHRELIAGLEYDYNDYYMNNIVISYLMNDGSVVIRDYKITDKDDADNKTKDDLAYDIISSEEMKRNKYFYLYDEENYNTENLYCYVTYTDKEGIAVDNVDFDKIREYLIKDVDNQAIDVDNAFNSIGFYYYDYAIDKKFYSGYSLQIIDKRIQGEKEDRGVDVINLTEFENTLNHLKLK